MHPNLLPGFRLFCTKAIIIDRKVDWVEREIDEILVGRVVNGDTEAFAELVGKYRDPIVSFASRILDDPIEAQDVAQEVFVKAFSASRRLRLTARFRNWLYVIARNLCLNELRRRARHRVIPLNLYEACSQECVPIEHSGSVCGSIEALAQQELLAKVEEGLSNLPEQQRIALVLLSDGSVSYEEIAGILQTSMSATKSLIHRGRETLKRRLTAYLPATA